MADGVRRISLADIYPGLDNALLVGVIVATQNVRTVNTRKNMSVKGVWNFTFRDSESDFINATLWGSPDFVSGYADQFHIGDVAAIVNARVAFRVTGSGSDDSFRPVVSSPFHLTLSEGTSEMHHHNLPDSAAYLRLLNIPTKAALEYLTLRDLNSSGERMQGTFVNLLVAVRNVNKVRQIQLRDGRQAECREVILFDETCSSVSLQLWDREYIVQASQWKPRETVLYMADVRLKWDDFRHSPSPSLSSKTIVTVNPLTPEAECLRVYAQEAPLQPSAIIDHLASNIVDVSSIKNVLSVRAILSRARAEGVRTPVAEEDQQFTALLYAVVTHLDVDHENMVVTKCTLCSRVSLDRKSCSNPECPVEQGSEMFIPQRVFNVRINLSDHTGTIKNCRLNGEAAETVLRCTVSQFDAMTADQKTGLKWTYLLERCAVRVLVLTASSLQKRQPYISVLSCAIADVAEVAARLPIL